MDSHLLNLPYSSVPMSTVVRSIKNIQNKIWSASENTRFWLPIFAFIILGLLLLRNMGLSIFSSDEHQYNQYARQIPLSTSPLPNYLYLKFYSYTNLCGKDFLSCTRILNALFFVASMPFIYLTARLSSGRRTALLIATLSMLAPINFYTAMFMPEAMFYFFFWVLTWLLLRDSKHWNAASEFFCGVLIGLLALIKLNGLFLLPAIILFIYQRFHSGENLSSRPTMRMIRMILIGTFLTRFGLGYRWGGLRGLDVLGTFYSSTMSVEAPNAKGISDIISLAQINFKGHLLFLCLAFGLPLTGIFQTAMNGFEKKTDNPASAQVSKLTILFFSTLVVLSSVAMAVFTTPNSPIESIHRIHLRYYNFAFPLLMIVTAAFFSSPSSFRFGTWKQRALYAGPIGAIALWAAFQKMNPYISEIVDNPEMQGLLSDKTAFYTVAAFSLATLIGWILSAQKAAKVFVYALLPMTVLASSYFLHQEIRHHAKPTQYEEALLLTKQFLGPTELSHAVLYGADQVSLLNSLFWIDGSKLPMTIAPKPDSQAIDPSVTIPADKDWLLVFDQMPMKFKYQDKIQLGPLQLYRLSSRIRIPFDQAAWFDVRQTKDLAKNESWGTWSSGPVVEIEFLQALPKNFRMTLVAKAYGPNIGKKFKAVLGKETLEFELGEKQKEISLQFKNLQQEKTLKFFVPEPTAPSSHEGLADNRKLGIGLVELLIEPQEI